MTDHLVISELLACFPDARLLREGEGGDQMYCDPSIHELCGMMSTVESEILYREAIRVGGRWLEIGTFVGWSAAVLARAGCRVVCVDPEFGPEATMGAGVRAKENWERAGVMAKIEPVGTYSADYFSDPRAFEMFDGVVIDGCHNEPVPEQDAVSASRRLKPGGVIVLHDFKGKPVQDAVDWLRGRGFATETFDTINGMAICRVSDP